VRRHRNVSGQRKVGSLACALPGALKAGGWWGAGIATGSTGADKLKLSCGLTAFTPALTCKARGRHDSSGEIRCLFDFLSSVRPVSYLQHIFTFLHASWLQYLALLRLFLILTTHTSCKRVVRRRRGKVFGCGEGHRSKWPPW
jgi:hypothetical protein